MIVLRGLYLDQSFLGEFLVDFRSVEYVLCSVRIVQCTQGFLGN